MKNRIVFLLSLALALTVRAAPPFVSESAWELQADGDFDGDGRADVIIVDRASGSFRIGYQTAPDSYTWVAARASGIANATGLGIGRLNSLTYDSLAVTGPDANRVNIVDANNTAVAGLPASVYPPSLGPNVSAVINIGGGGNTPHDDLYVASVYNAGPAFRQTLLRNDGTTNRTVISDAALAAWRERVNAVLLHTNRPARLALLDRVTAPDTDLFRLVDVSGGAAATLSSVATLRTPMPFEYVYGQFVTASPLTQFLLYPPSGWYFFTYHVTEPSPGNYALVYTNQFTFTNNMARMFALPGTNGTKLLVFYTNGISAAVYDFDGINAPAVVQQFNADEGEHFTGAGVLGNSSFISYSAPHGQNTSANFKQWQWNGSGYTLAASGALPRASSYSSSGNVMQFRFEPFVNASPTLLRVNNAGDWSSRPQFSGVPANISVRSETFLNTTQGLVNPVTAALGAAHPNALFALANQYTNQISLFSFSPAAGDKVSEVTIAPAPGLYPTAVRLSFSAVNPSDSIHYRLGSGPWQLWNAAVVERLFTNVTVQYYGQPAGNAAKSAIRSAAYAFTPGPDTLDSDGDGVPDYVELAKGLDPNGGADSDGDGYTDLEEVIRGTNPLLNTSVPTNFPHLDERAAFDLTTTPRPLDPFAGTATLSATGMAVRAFNLQGSLLSVGLTTNPPAPFARLTNIAVVAEDRLFTAATEQHFDIATANPDKTVGREMLGLLGMPALALPSIPYVYGGLNITNEANGWIASASNTFKALPRTVVTNNLRVDSTIAALLVEMKVAQILGQRGSNWWTNLTLFPFRVADVARTNPDAPTLLSLESRTSTQPGYKLQTIFATVSNLVEIGGPDANALRTVATDIYRISGQQNNTNPATFVLPVDELRHFLWTGTMDSNYLAWATSAASFAAARAGASNILAQVPPRPTTNIVLAVRSDTAGPCRVLDPHAGGAPFSLLDSSGLPFSFPDNFDLLAGSLVEVFGYTDVTNSGCGYRGIEVIGTLLCSVPIASDTDGDGNLLIDTWEKQFFGYLDFAHPFADADGDGYSNLQEMLEGSDPRDFHGRPSVPAAAFSLVLSLGESGGQMEISFEWPDAYLDDFEFGVRHTSAIGDPFTDLMAAGPIAVAPNHYKMSFAPPGTAQHYFYLTVSLK